MHWKNISIENPVSLSVRDAQLVIDDRGNKVTVPIEEISCLLLDSPQISLTKAVLEQCVENGSVVIVTDARHLPHGVMFSNQRYHRQLEIMELQKNFGQSGKKKLWSLLVKAKIVNQANCLKLLGKDYSVLLKFVGSIRSGDPENIEAQAARYYFPRYAEDFHRDQDGDDRLNAMLNYGYALIRARLAQRLAAKGFILSFGVHHRNVQNAFNLVDDFIEPWRPVVDLYARRVFASRREDIELSKADRHDLINIFSSRVRWKKDIGIVNQTISDYVDQIPDLFSGNTDIFTAPALFAEKS